MENIDIVQIKSMSFINDKMSYAAPGWEEMGQYCFNLAQKIISSGKEFDRLITMAKGGWTWAKTLADYLKFRDIGSIHIELYTSFVNSTKCPVIVQALPVSVRGERILLFDDISDSGETLAFAQKYLNMSGVKSISTATLFFKPWSQTKPDFYQCEAKCWLILPHEIREAVDNICKPWIDKGVPKSEAISRLVKIGLPKDQIEYYLNIKDQSAKIKT